MHMSSIVETFITCDNLSFTYPLGKPVLRDLNFTVPKGGTLAIVGASGCGKSTLLKLIAGILGGHLRDHLLEGSIKIDGIGGIEYRESGSLAFMFQEPTLLPNRTVRANIELPFDIMNNKAVNIVDSLLEAVGLTHYADYLPAALSGGMKARVTMARSFATSPELLLLDEPFSSLDIAWKKTLYMELDRLKCRQNTTVVMVTHDVQEALLLANQVIVLDESGAIALRLEVKSSFSIQQRIADISGFMATVYREYMLPIQDVIINRQGLQR